MRVFHKTINVIGGLIFTPPPPFEGLKIAIKW